MTKKKAPTAISVLRDNRGRFLKGEHCTVPTLVYEKRRAIAEATTPEDAIEALDAIRQLARTTENEWVKLTAWQAWLDRVIGKPRQELQVEKTETSTHVNVDVQALSTEQLLEIERIVTRQQETAPFVIEQQPAPLVIDATIVEEKPTELELDGIVFPDGI